MKIIQGIIIGGLFSSILSMVCSYYIAFTSNTVSDFGLTTRDFWWLATLLGGLAGFVLGAIVGLIVSSLSLNVVLAGLIGLLLTGIPAILFSQVAQGKFDENHIRFGIALIFIETLTGIFVSLALRVLKQ